MPSSYTNPEYPYIHSPDQDAAEPVHHPVIIVGGGPAGLAAAMDLAMYGVKSVVLDDNNTVSVGSRAICLAKRTLEICDRYGCTSVKNRSTTSICWRSPITKYPPSSTCSSTIWKSTW